MDSPAGRKRSTRRTSAVTFTDQENEDPSVSGTPNKSKIKSESLKQGSPKTPFTPMQNMVHSMRDRLEIQLGTAQLLGSAQLESNTSLNLKRDDWMSKSCASTNVSPSLARLRNTPAAEGLKAKQHVLEQKHRNTKNNCNSLNVGGGVCLWPDMDNMRLNQSETVWLVMVNVLLIPVLVWCFYILHGDLVFKLLDFTDKLKIFEQSHYINISTSNEEFNQDVLHWHTDMESLINEIHNEFDVTLTKTSLRYKCCVLVYIAGILTLLYFLADNVLAQSKLSPNRIKSWVTLLTVMGLWTVLTMKLFILAQRLEKSVEDNVHILSKYLGKLVHTDQDLSRFHNILLHWRTCCLPPTSQGTLKVMGLLAIQDVTYYLQYYSLPIITALLSPIIKLIVSLKDIYGAPVSNYE